MAITVDFKDFDFVQQTQNTLGQMTFKRLIGRKMVKIIQERTRAGFGFSSAFSTNLSKLKKLAPATIENRTRALKRKRPFKLNKKLTSPSKSNLTHTGRMIQSLKVKSIRGGFKIEATGQRRDTKLTNKQVLAANAKLGRYFNQLSKAEIKLLTEFIDEELDKVLAKA